MSAAFQIEPPEAVWVNQLELVEWNMLEMLGAFSSENDFFRFVFGQHLNSGGQRTRARIALACSGALGLETEDAIAMASTVELLHNASLIQDDLQDSTRERRGCDAIWHRYGKNVAIGLTDLTISSSFKALASVTGTGVLPEMIDRVHRAIAVTLRGQADDLSNTTGGVEAAISMARRKSGPLFALSLELPLIYSGQVSHLAAATEAAESFGVGYQICDDIFDVEEDRAVKARGNIVLALEDEGWKAGSVSRACRLAHQYLDRADYSARFLPAGTGESLVRLISKARGRLDQ